LEPKEDLEPYNQGATSDPMMSQNFQGRKIAGLFSTYILYNANS
jgi:hypothetical protein